MKKTAKTVLSVIGALALIAASAALVYRFDSKVHDWVDGQFGRTSQLTGSDSTSTSADGSLKAVLYGGPRFAAKAGAAKTCVATITPDAATDKTVLWSTSDPAKVALSSASTQSGGAQTLTLKAVFNGTVTVTAKAEALTSAYTTFSVTVYNSVTTMTVVGIAQDSDSNCFFTTLDGISSTATPSFGLHEIVPGGYYASGDGVYYSLSAANAIVVKKGSYNVDVVLRLWGRDASVLPDVDERDLGGHSDESGALAGYDSSDSKCIYAVWCLADTTGASVTLSFEDASITFTTAKYVAPTAVTGGGAVRFS